MTTDSTHEKSVCRQEWSRALGFKKPIVPLWVHSDINVTFRIQDRQRIDFRKSFDVGLANLRDYLAWLNSPEGILQDYRDRLLDAERDFRAPPKRKTSRTFKQTLMSLTNKLNPSRKLLIIPKL